MKFLTFGSSIIGAQYGQAEYKDQAAFTGFAVQVSGSHSLNFSQHAGDRHDTGVVPSTKESVLFVNRSLRLRASSIGVRVYTAIPIILNLRTMEGYCF